MQWRPPTSSQILQCLHLRFYDDHEEDAALRGTIFHLCLRVGEFVCVCVCFVWPVSRGQLRRGLAEQLGHICPEFWYLKTHVEFDIPMSTEGVVKEVLLKGRPALEEVPCA